MDYRYVEQIITNTLKTCTPDGFWDEGGVDPEELAALRISFDS